MTTMATQSRGTFWRAFTPLFGAGLTGVAALVPLVAPGLRKVIENPPSGATLPSLPVLMAVQLGQVALITGVSVAVGLALAPKLGLRSHVAEVARRGGQVWQAIKPDVLPGVAAGAATGAGIVALDLLMRPWTPEPLRIVQPQPRDLMTTLGGVLYGGITEELMMRWGLMTLLAWVLWRVAQREHDRPRAWLMWTALGVVAIVFGVAHLGAASLTAPLTPAVVARTIILNAGAGVVFGWLYWRRSLEAAMIAHAGGHVTMTLLSVLLLPLAR